MKFLFINPDGSKVSGVYSYCQLLFSNHRDCLVLSLNEDEPPEAVDPARFFHLPFAHSHNVTDVAKAIVNIVHGFPDEPVVLLPNNGAVPFLACLKALASAPGLVDRLRLLAIVHSDHPDSYAMAERHAAQIARFIGVSPTIAARLQQALPDRLTHIVSLPYPVRVPSRSAATAPDSGGVLRLVYAGRLEESQKRVSRLPRLAERLHACGTAFTLDIFGEGEARPDLVRTLAALPGQLHEQIRLLGAVSAAEMQQRFADYDAVVLVSSYEGTPIVLLEAMAAGVCPVVMEIASGIPDLVEQGVTGYRVPQGDVDAMAAALAGLSRDRARLVRTQHAAREKVTRDYGVAGHLQRLDEVLQACVDAPGPVPSENLDSPIEEAVAALVAQVDRNQACTNVLWGGGMFGRAVADRCLAAGIGFHAVVDADPDKQGRQYRGIPYIAPVDLLAFKADQILVGSIAFATEIAQQVGDLYDQAGQSAPRIVSSRAE